jgi:hypothetical protein
MLLPVVAPLSPPAQLAILVAAGAAVYVLATALFARKVVAPMWESWRAVSPRAAR